MGYESLSTVIVLVIAVLILAVWLPRRTVNGMKHVMEHREDRYSSSLHLVDADSGTKFSDVRTPQAKGAIMQPSQPRKAMSAAEHIAQVRRMRREAARRRAIIAAVLLAATVVVVVLAVVLRFSPLFALIPGALLAAVVGLGVNASRHARAWERKVGERRRAASASKAAGAQRDPGERRMQDDSSQAPTVTMEQREIRRALHESERARRARKNAEVMDVDSVVVEERTDADGQIVVQRAEHIDGERSQSGPEPSAATVEPEPADATTELDEVRPAHALDAFEVASSQDLISFTLGEPRNGFDVGAESPESREIRSTRQVAKAVPPEATAEDDAQDDQSDQPQADAPVVASLDEPDSASFHESEVKAQVEAPVATSESLGADLETILTRRGA